MNRAVLADAAGAGTGLTLRDRWLAFRNRLLSSPAFQARATRFPLTRFVARRRTRALFDLCAGFVYSQVLFACVELRLFAVLAEGQQHLDALALRFGMMPERAARLLDAAVSLDLLERQGEGRYGLGVLGAALVGNPAVAAMVEHHAMLYADLRDPVGLLRGERPEGDLARYWAYARNQAPATLVGEEVAAYSDLMGSSQPLVAAEILAAYPFKGHHHLLDLGGGDGSFLMAVAARAPDLRLTLFDLPPVAERARARFAAAGLGARAEAVGGSFLSDPLPQADLVTLVRVVHDHDDAEALAILRAARRAVTGGGTLLLAEPMAGTAGAEPVGDAYFGFYLLAMGSGRPRTPDELKRLLGEAGFTSARLVRTRVPLLTRLIVARP